MINKYTEKQLADIIYEYGEEKYSRSIANAIVRERENKKIETTLELTEIIRESVPEKYRRTHHPARKVFQAIRIEVNGELEALKEGLVQGLELLEENGRLVVISFHSLEDRIVKSSFRKNENPCICPSHFPVCVCGNVSKGKVITRKPILPSEEELTVNSRSKSAKLRIFERA